MSARCRGAGHHSDLQPDLQVLHPRTSACLSSVREATSPMTRHLLLFTRDLRTHVNAAVLILSMAERIVRQLGRWPSRETFAGK